VIRASQPIIPLRRCARSGTGFPSTGRCWNWGAGPEFDPLTGQIEQRSLNGGFVLAMGRIKPSPRGRFYPFARWQYYRGGFKGATNAPRLETGELALGLEVLATPALELTATYGWASRKEAGECRFGQADGQILRVQAQWNYRSGLRPDCIGSTALSICLSAFSESPGDSTRLENASAATLWLWPGLWPAMRGGVGLWLSARMGLWLERAHRRGAVGFAASGIFARGHARGFG